MKADISINLCVSMLSVCHPTAWFHLIGIEAPELEFFFKEWPTNVGRIVQFSFVRMKEHVNE